MSTFRLLSAGIFALCLLFSQESYAACTGAGTCALTDNGSVVQLAPSATTDTTNAANITSGTLPAARLPALTGDATTPAGSAATTVAKINGATLGTTTATANNVLTANGTSWGTTTPSSWFDSAYCNTIGYAIVRLSGAWTCSKYVAANPVWWGADPTGAADSTAAFNSALAASAVVEFPAGTFKLNSAISYSISAGIASVTIKGQGQDLTILNWPNIAGGLTLTYSGLGSSAHIRDLSITTGQANGGNAITLTLAASLVNPALTATSDLYRVTIRGADGYAVTDYWTTALQIVNVSNVQVENITIFGALTPAGNGITIVGLTGSSTYAVVLNVAKSNIEYVATGLLYGSYVQGVSVDQSNLQCAGNGIASAGSETGALVQLSITNSQFSSCTVTGGTSILTATGIGSMEITNNMFVITGTNQTAINITQAKHFTIVGNEVQGIGSVTSNGIIIGPSISSSPGVIDANDIFGFAGSGIWLQASSTLVNVTNNVFTANGVNITNSGTLNNIVNNIGYNPVGPAAITVTASPMTYTASASPETVYIYGGTVSSVTVDKNGGGLTTIACAVSPCSVNLAPNEQAKVTYTAAPSMNKMIH